MHSVLKTVLKALVRCYQLVFAPAVAALSGSRCRFYPSCSHYAIACLDKHSVPTALTRITGRLLKCGPWHPGGIDQP